MRVRPLLSLDTRVLRLAKIILTCTSISLVGVTLTYLLSLKTGHSFTDLTRDPAQVYNTSAVVGFLSHLGILVWTASAAICFFTSGLIDRRSNRRFFLYSGLLSTLLVLDDEFLLHEIVFPNYLGIPENYVYLGYICLIFAYFIYFHRQILKNNYILLLISSMALGLSLGLDLIIPSATALEDCFKFAGIVFWLAYFVDAAIAQLKLKMYQT